jgi:hypothetical protein
MQHPILPIAVAKDIVILDEPPSSDLPYEMPIGKLLID